MVSHWQWELELVQRFTMSSIIWRNLMVILIVKRWFQVTDARHRCQGRSGTIEEIRNKFLGGTVVEYRVKFDANEHDSERFDPVFTNELEVILQPEQSEGDSSQLAKPLSPEAAAGDRVNPGFHNNNPTLDFRSNYWS